MNPQAAWAKLVRGESTPRLPSSLDYRDADQISRQVDIDGEPWIILLRRGVDV